MPGMLVLLDPQWVSLFRETKDPTFNFLIFGLVVLKLFKEW
jgi:hypothetical protein